MKHATRTTGCDAAATWAGVSSIGSHAFMHAHYDPCVRGYADGGNVPVVVMFKKGQGKPKQDVLQVKGDIDDRNLDAVFLATNNLTYAAGEDAFFVKVW